MSGMPDVEAEAWLAALNVALRRGDTLGAVGYSEAQLGAAPPRIIVLGAPRSGTTLAVQILARALDVSYVSNMAAMFWSAPALGVLLAERLFPGHHPDDVSSHFGRTSGAFGPHEMGRFWQEQLSLDGLSEPTKQPGDLSLRGIVRELQAVALVSGRPFLLKSLHLAWCMPRFAQLDSRSLFVLIRRPDHEVAASLFDMRVRLRGTAEAWTSLVPERARGFVDPREQVAAQAILLRSAAERVLLDPSARGRTVEISLEMLQQEPKAFTDVVQRMLQSLGSPTSRRLLASPSDGVVASASKELGDWVRCVESVAERLNEVAYIGQ